MNELILASIFALSALDAMRDGFRCPEILEISDRRWHIIKWLSWYPLMILLAFQLDFWYLVFSPLVGFFGWRWGLLWTPVKWETQWFILFRRAWDWVKSKVKK